VLCTEDVGFRAHYLSAKVKLDNVVMLKDSLIARVRSPMSSDVVNARPGRKCDTAAGEVVLDQLSHLVGFRV
jgi:hypothetical protein